MPEAKVKMHVRDLGPGVKAIDIEGELTAFSEPVLNDAFNEASENGTTSLVLGFEGLDYMNSGGIGLLVTMLIRAQRNGQTMAAFGLTDHYKEIFSVTRLDEAITIYPDEAAVLASA